jgi:hypothetical protein
MSIEEVTFALLDALEATHSDYMLVGAVAAIHYGVARSTFDLAAVVQLTPGRVALLASQLGAAFRLEPQLE